MKILNLKLQNFMGIKNLELKFNGQDANVYGTNAAGKTTCFSAFTWLMFGKDSLNRADFQIKTLGPDGEPEHGLEHAVEAVLELEDGQRLALKKVYQEKWTKKRGSATAEFTGHTTDHYIDGVPVQKKEYDAKIAEIADENIFRLLTDPRYFNEVLHWTDRRKLLLEVCGDVTDAEVIASNPDLSKLSEILGNRTIEQHRKVIQARRTEINKELEKIPVRIDEVKLGLPNIDDITNPEALPNDIAKLREELLAKQEELAQARAGGKIAELTAKKRMIEAKMLEEKNRMIGEATRKSDLLREELFHVNDTISKTKSEIDYRKMKARNTKTEISNLEEKLKTLRTSWHAENSKTFEFDQSETCPYCGQALPQEQLQEAREKALAEFNRKKAEQLEAINAEGRRLAARKSELEDELKDLLREQEMIEATLPGLEKKQEALQTEIKSIQDSLKNLEPSAEYIRLQKEYEEIQEQIRQAQEDVSTTVAAIQKEIDEISADLRALEQAAARIEARGKAHERISELMEEERRLAAEYEDLERQLYLTEEFIRAKVRLLEDKINSKFKMARFKLFETQVNGALSECCETTFNGVPYSNLNNGAKIQIGLDIVRTLQAHYGFTCPVWIDNRESVVQIPEMDCQIISLIVSEKDKKLRIELAERE